MNTSKRNYLFGTTVLAGMLAVAAPAFAQDAAPQQDEEATEVEEIVVTGSLIRRDPTTAPTPLIQTTREEIIQQGEQNVVDFLADIPALQNSQVPEDTTGGFVGIGGLSTLNLRNLGGARTLVLVDGRRHVGGNRGGVSVDVDTIPTPLIQSVEIITGGASSLYGADAVSGVVNFIMRTDFEGIELDAGVSQLTQDEGSLNQRYSVLVGRNFLDDRLNIYGFAEYQTSDIVNDRELQIDWIQNEERLQNVDFDPASAPNDGNRDIERIAGLRTLSRPFGGILTIANGQQPSPTSDPDIGYSGCGSNGTALVPLTAAQNNTFGNTGCFPINVGSSFRFREGGTPYAIDIGTGFIPNGTAGRTLTVGGNGDGLVVQDINRLPEQENKRFQVGLNFEVTDNIDAFAEFKYVDDYNLDVFQPHFSDVGIRPFVGNEYGIVDAATLTSGRIGLDNAYLDPALRTAIQNNVRTVYAANGTVLGTQADPRAAFRLFSYDLGFRPQTNERELTRFVGGFRGDFDQLLFLRDGQWELGYTFGQTDIVNNEPETIDLQRWFFSADAVRDTANVVGQGANAIVCRVQILSRQGVPIINQATGTAYAANDPTITGCVPQNIFGLGGQAVARNYILTDFLRTDTNTQEDWRGFVSGNLWDFWGAGPIGIALGGEYRKESWESTVADFGPRVLFGNSGSNLDEVSYDVTEGFVELRVPLLTDVPFAQTLELSGAFRYSDYSTGDQTETYSTALFWQPIDDIAFRGTYGEASRAPTLSELFNPLAATFPNITDGCSLPVINATSDTRIRNNRIANCAARGVPATYVDPNPNTSNSGFSGSNPNLLTETSTSYTLSTILTPTFFPNFEVVLDYYSIDIDDAIATLGIQTLVNLCYDEDVSNTNACGQFTRDPTTFEITNFIQGPFNFAGLRARGMDFQASYRTDLLDLIGRDWGTLNFSLAGNYLIRRQDFTSPTDPNFPTQIDGTANNPRVRFRTNTTWTQGPLQVSWRVDFQRAYDIVYRRNIVTNLDSRDFEYLRAPNFWQHDVSFRYNFNDEITLRGGVTNLFDAEPSIQAGLQDQYDLFGRRFFFGINYRY
ncbi:TonB-dependent receptor domain-containing protein [Brevundimonas bacteroides]|uniref:TonB-dependent receptor domain-containing protein n=1 Tax=Brevundimonas bacteroides TaxID=74311 RepID=UPI000497C0D6|nr:TonB-dependent receptor [Brevundimonas bacteroides]